MKEYNMTEEMAENRSVWHMMKIKAGPLIHGGGLYIPAYHSGFSGIITEKHIKLRYYGITARAKLFRNVFDYGKLIGSRQ